MATIAVVRPLQACDDDPHLKAQPKHWEFSIVVDKLVTYDARTCRQLRFYWDVDQSEHDALKALVGSVIGVDAQSVIISLKGYQLEIDFCFDESLIDTIVFFDVNDQRCYRSPGDDEVHEFETRVTQQVLKKTFGHLILL